MELHPYSVTCTPRLNDMIWRPHNHISRTILWRQVSIGLHLIFPCSGNIREENGPGSHFPLQLLRKPRTWLENNECVLAPSALAWGPLFYLCGCYLSPGGAWRRQWGVWTHQDYLNRPLRGSKATPVNDGPINLQQLTPPAQSWPLRCHCVYIKSIFTSDLK